MKNQQTKKIVILFIFGIFLLSSAIAQSSWQSIGGANNVRTMAAGHDGRWYVSSFEMIITSSDQGITWDTLQMPDTFISDFFTVAVAPDSGDVLFAAEPGVFRYRDGIPVRMDSILIGSYSLAFDSSGRWFASGSKGVLRSTDRGESWAIVHPALGGFTDGLLCTSTGRFFAMSMTGGLFRTTDGGNSWDSILTSPIADGIVSAITASPTTEFIYAAIAVIRNTFSRADLYRSTNHGDHWTLIDSSMQYIESLLADPSGNIYAGGSSLRRSTDNGETWHSFMTGLHAHFDVSAVTHISGNIFAATDQGIYRLTKNTTVSGYWSELPNSPYLEQNFPNPFNPTTTISYYLPQASMVRLNVYDLLGREVAILVNEEQTSGRKFVQWSAADMSGGIYFYRLTAGKYTHTRNLLLLR